MTWLWLRRPMFALRWFTPPSTYRIKLYEFENTTFIFLLSRLQLESISVFSSMKTVFTSNQKKNVDIHCGYRLSNRRLHAVRQIKEEQNWTKNAEKKKTEFLGRKFGLNISMQCTDGTIKIDRNDSEWRLAAGYQYIYKYFLYCIVSTLPERIFSVRVR